MCAIYSYRANYYVVYTKTHMRDLSYELGSDRTAIAVVVAYACLGSVVMAALDDVPQWYMALMYFVYFKILFRYDKCTVSYLECKIRCVKKTRGYIYSFLNSFNKLRDDRVMFPVVTAYVALLSFVYFGYLGKRMLL